MDSQTIIQIIIGLIGGLGLFLLGMKQMSEGMQAVAGERLRKLISAVTDNRLVACGVGASITALIQSSSVTAVMVVGMVNAGLMTLRQAIGVIMGTNIGTTITAWLVALHIADYGLPILGIAVFFYLFSRNDRVRFTAMIWMGLGMVFFGLELMKNGMTPLRDLPEFISLMARFSPTGLFGILKCIIVGSLVTAIIQSSSATIAITITLAVTRTIDYPTAVALVLGQNIGTTITAYLASLNANTNAKRTAFAHILFNVLGVAIMVPLFNQYVWFLNIMISENAAIATRIAFAHTFFNLFIVILLLPLIQPFSQLVLKLVPARKRKEKPHLTYLDIRLVESPAIGIQQSHKEIVKMSQEIEIMMRWLKESLLDPDLNKKRDDRIFHRETVLDLIQKEIMEFISHIITSNLPHSVADESRSQLRIADEYESISDYIVTILKLLCRAKNNQLKFSKQGEKELSDLHDQITAYFQMIALAVSDKNSEIMPKANSRGNTLTHQIKQVRSNHLSRLEANQTTPLVSLVYMDILSSYRRIKDHTFNIAEVLAGEK